MFDARRDAAKVAGHGGATTDAIGIALAFGLVGGALFAIGDRRRARRSG